MTLHSLHRSLGLIFILPFIGWILTGLVFLFKPGYQQAYERITPTAYPISQTLKINPQPHWQSFRVIKTILGTHLLVKTNTEALQLSPTTQEPIPAPSQTDIERLLTDAIKLNPARYGDIISFEDQRFMTSTGVELTLDWPTLNITQKGRDTRIISTLYKIHYLQWLGHKSANKILGALGLLGLLFLVYFGCLIYCKNLLKS